MEDKNLEIIKHYGVLPQLKYFQTEVYELTEAIVLEQYGEDNKEHVAEEIADVFVMLDQFMAYYEIDGDEIKRIADFKIDRQLKRISEEQGE